MALNTSSVKQASLTCPWPPSPSWGKFLGAGTEHDCRWSTLSCSCLRQNAFSCRVLCGESSGNQTFMGLAGRHEVFPAWLISLATGMMIAWACNGRIWGLLGAASAEGHSHGAQDSPAFRGLGRLGDAQAPGFGKQVSVHQVHCAGSDLQQTQSRSFRKSA